MSVTDSTDPTQIPIQHRSQEGLLGIIVTTCVVIPFFTWGRIYGRTIRWSHLRADDFVLILATAFALASSVLTAMVSMYGIGYHRINMKPEWIPITLKLYFFISILFPFVTGITKMSVCLAYLRLFPGRWDRIYSYGLIFVMALYTLAGFFLVLFRCHPMRHFWNVLAGVKCTQGNLLTYQVLNTSTDFAVFLWPLRTLSNMNLPLRKRPALIFAFSLGLVVCLAGIARIVLQCLAWGTSDLTFYAYRSLCAASLESNIGVMCACLLGCQPILTEVKKWFARREERGMSWRSPTEMVETSFTPPRGRSPAPKPIGTRSNTLGDFDVRGERRGEVVQ